MTHFRSSVVLALATAPMANMLPLDRLNMSIDQCLDPSHKRRKIREVESEDACAEVQTNGSKASLKPICETN
jgi:hypothetical protein